MLDEVYAFPSLHTIDGNWNREPLKEYRGMTLRDQFAMAALTGHLSSLDPKFVGSPAFKEPGFAAWCYGIADAMLAARGNKS